MSATTTLDPAILARDRWLDGLHLSYRVPDSTDDPTGKATSVTFRRLVEAYRVAQENATTKPQQLQDAVDTVQRSEQNLETKKSAERARWTGRRAYSTEVKNMEEELKVAKKRKARYQENRAPGKLWKKFLARREAEAKLEDFLYFQNPRARLRKALAIESLASTEERDTSTLSRIMRFGGPHVPWLRKLIFHYDNEDVGGFSRNKTYSRAVRMVPPEQLRLWTPAPRRPSGGLENNPDLGSNTPVHVGRDRLQHLDVTFDLDAIEARRCIVDRRWGAIASDPTMTHDRFRQQEPAYDQLPTAFTDRSTKHYRNPTGQNFTRTNEGLWLSAAETNEDWQTSFDSRGPVAFSWVRTDVEVGDTAESILGRVNDPWNHNARPGDTGATGHWRLVTATSRDRPGRKERHAVDSEEPSSPVETGSEADGSDDGPGNGSVGGPDSGAGGDD